MSLLSEFSIQLYSVREETAKDFPGVLKKLGDIGYTGVEFAGYGDIAAPQMKEYLQQCGLRSVGSHIMLEQLQNNWEQELEYNQTLGTQYLIVPYAKVENRADILALAKELNQLGQKCKDAGFGFGYHNHYHEFVRDGGDYLLDILLAETDPQLVKLELDLYWTAYAGVNGMDYMQQHKDRIRLLHLKQIKDYETKECVDLGDGVIDFAPIIAAAKQGGVEHFILEQEAFPVSPFISVKNGFEHIMSL